MDPSGRFEKSNVTTENERIGCCAFGKKGVFIYGKGNTLEHSFMSVKPVSLLVQVLFCHFLHGVVRSERSSALALTFASKISTIVMYLDVCSEYM